MQKTIKSEKLYFTPLIFNCSSDVDNAAFQQLIADKNPVITDTFADQLEDLAACLFPAQYLSGTGTPELVKQIPDNAHPEKAGNWVYFPWKNIAVKLLAESDFITCRTNRNKLKITPDQQQLLGQKNILFVGLSVGQSAAATFAMQRIGGTLQLADFDTLSLSNMNRLRASVTDIGTAKCIIAARQIAEQDPYIKVLCHESGINDENIDAILTQNGTGKIDLIVEECDSLEVKFLIREKARQYGIPVIMETSDKGVVDIERFDLEPERPLLHGLAGDLTAKQVAVMNRQERFELLTKIVDYSKISDGLKQSYAALGKEVITWPQLGYEVTLGGATLAYTAGIILSGLPMKSGRIYVDLDTVFSRNQWI